MSRQPVICIIKTYNHIYVKALILGFLTSLNCTMLTGQITCAQKVSIYGKKQQQRNENKQKNKKQKQTKSYYRSATC